MPGASRNRPKPPPPFNGVRPRSADGTSGCSAGVERRGVGVGYVERCGATQRMRRRHRLPLERRPCCCCACALSAGAAVGKLPAFLIAPYGRKRWGAAFRCMKGSSTCTSLLKLSNREELFTSMSNWHPAPVHRAGHSISSRGCPPLLVGEYCSQ